jgi:hypothetical protein
MERIIIKLEYAFWIIENRKRTPVVMVLGEHTKVGKWNEMDYA